MQQNRVKKGRKDEGSDKPDRGAFGQRPQGRHCHEEQGDLTVGDVKSAHRTCLLTATTTTNPGQMRMRSISSRESWSSVWSYSLVVWEDSWEARARAFSNDPPFWR